MAETFGRYEVLEKLGVGGMAEVFLVRSRGPAGVEKRLVIKRVLPSFASSARFKAMFVDEAKIAASLNHPNIVQVYDFGRVEDHYYLAMEYVEGSDLAGLLVRGLPKKPPAGDSAWLVGELLKGLDYAHRKRDADGEGLHIVHRDVSPDNVLVSREGGVKITDFGIARARGAAPEEAGVVKGKLAYMAPEQARGGEIGPRTDVYAAGILLWELLCGCGLFVGRDQGLGMAGRLDTDVPPPRTIDPVVPQALEAICLRALAADPADRYPTARDMAVDLSRFLLSTGEVHDAFSLSEWVAAVERRAAETPPPRPRTPTPAPVPEVAEPEPPAAPAQPEPPAPPVRTVEVRRPERPAKRVVERKDVFCVCGVVSGFTELRRAVGADRFRGAVLDYLSMLEAIAFKADAQARRVSEAGFLFVVGLPLSRETDGERALALALDVIEATDGVNRNLESEVSVSIGVYRGGCTLQRTPGEPSFEATLDPTLEEMSRRLARDAQPGEVLVSGAAQRTARRAFSFEEVEPLLVPDAPEVTGVTAGRLRVYALQGPRDRAERAAATRAARGRLLGRELELRTLEQAFSRVALEGRGAAVVVVGEAGVGKSALLEELLSRVAGEARVLRAEAGRLEAAPHGLLVDLLGDLLDLRLSDGSRDVKRKLEEWYRAYSEGLRPHEARYLLHSLGGLLSVRYRDSAVEGLDPEARQARTFLSLRRVLERMAAGRPLVVAFDGLERVDAASLAFLQELVRGGLPPRVLAVFALRPGGEADGLVELRGLQVLRLDELSERARVALVRDWLGPRTDAARIAAALAARAGGNPLFLRESLDALEERGLLEAAAARDEEAPWPVPTSIEGLVAARLDVLAEADRDVVVRTAQVARPLTAELLAAVAPNLEGPSQALGRLADLGLLVPREGGAYAFRYPLLKEVAAGLLPADEAPGLHARAAAWLEERLEEGEAVDRGELARHHEAAGHVEEAGRHLYAAGRAALRSGGVGLAVRLLDRACGLLPAGTAEGLAAAEHAERAWERCGRQEGRLDAVRRYRAAAEAAGDVAGVCDGYNRLGRAHLDRMEVDDAESVLREGLERSRCSGERKAEGKALAYLGYAARNRGDYPAAEERCEEALRIFESEGLHEDQAATWTILGIIRRQTGRPDQALECYRRSLQAQEHSRNETVREATLINLAIAADTLGYHVLALGRLREALALNREIGSRRRTGLIHGNRGAVYLELGRPDLADHCLRKAAALARERESPIHEGAVLVSLARAELERARLHEAEMALTYAAAVAADTVSAYLDCQVELARALLLLARRDPAQALTLADAAGLRAQEAGLAAEEALARARAAQALVRLGRREEAVERADAGLAVLPAGVRTVEVEVRLARWEADRATGAEHLELARDNLEARVAHIDKEALRRSFLSRPLHRRALEAP